MQVVERVENTSNESPLIEMVKAGNRDLTKSTSRDILVIDKKTPQIIICI